MANKKISQLTTAASLNNADQFPIVQSSFTKKTLFQTIKTAIQTITGLTAKGALSVNDELLINDSADSFEPKKVTVQTVINAVAGQSIIPVFKEGCRLSNNVGDPTNDIDVTAGKWTSSDLTTIMEPGAMTKQLDASWSAGTNAGGLFTGAKANSTWYYFFIIYNPTTDTADYGFHTAVNPTAVLPAGFTKYKLIGAVCTSGAGAILAFYQVGTEFFFKTFVNDISVANLSTSRVAYTITAPPNTKATLMLRGFKSSAYSILFTSINDTDQTPDANFNNIRGNDFSAEITLSIITNASSEIGARSDTSSTALRGWTRSFWLEL